MWLALPFASGFGLWRLAVCCVASLPMDAWLPRGAPTRAPLKPYGHAALHLQRSEYSRVDEAHVGREGVAVYRSVQISCTTTESVKASGLTSGLVPIHLSSALPHESPSHPQLP